MKISFRKKNDLYYKLKKADTRFVVNFGGAGSSKSYSQTQVEIAKCLEGKQKLLVIRKVSTTLNDSVVSLFKKFLTKLPDVRFNSVEKHFYLPNGSEILFKGLDDAEKIKSVAGITRIWIEEATELNLEDFRQLNLRLRGSDNLQMSLTFNPISVNHWLYDEFFKVSKPNSTIFKTTYLDNKYIDDAYIQELLRLKELDENLYNVYVLGNFGVIRTGNEWASKFLYNTHVKECEYDPDLPLHISFDFNGKPYMSAIVNQVYLNKKGTEIHQIAEYALAHPQNTTEDVCRTILSDFELYGIDSIYIYGDSTGRNKNARKTKDENEHHYEVIENIFRDYMDSNSNRVMSRNPSLSKRKYFYIYLLSGYYNIDVLIDPKCTHTINDFQMAKEDANGGILKETAKDETGAVYQKIGHHLDCHNYFTCSVFRNEFDSVK